MGKSRSSKFSTLKDTCNACMRQLKETLRHQECAEVKSGADGGMKSCVSLHARQYNNVFPLQNTLKYFKP